MTMRVEEIPLSGLMVLRQRIDPVLAQDFQEEWLDRLADVAERKDFGKLGISVITAINKTEHFVNRPSATGRLLKALSINRGGMLLAINLQSPEGAQTFHMDDTYTMGIVTIVHGADEGAFDYAPEAANQEEAEQNFRTIELNAGDVVIQSRPLQWHRGRNLGNSPRITAAIAAEAPSE